MCDNRGANVKPDDSSTTRPATGFAGETPAELIVTWLQASHFLQGVPVAQLGKLASYARLRELRAGERLWRQADQAVTFHLIVSGLISIQRMHTSGAEHTIGIFGAKDSVGEIAVCQRIKYPADAIAISKTAKVLAIDAERMLADAKTCGELAHALHLSLSRHGTALLQKVQLVAVGNVKARLAGVLLHLAERFGEELADGAILVPVVLSRAALASLVSARTETVIRALRPWEVADVVVTRDDGFVLRSLATLRAEASKG